MLITSSLFPSLIPKIFIYKLDFLKMIRVWKKYNETQTIQLHTHKLSPILKVITSKDIITWK